MLHYVHHPKSNLHLLIPLHHVYFPLLSLKIIVLVLEGGVVKWLRAQALKSDWGLSPGLDVYLLCDLTPLYLIFLICKLGIILEPTSRVVMRTKWVNACNMFKIVSINVDLYYHQPDREVRCWFIIFYLSGCIFNSSSFSYYNQGLTPQSYLLCSS